MNNEMEQWCWIQAMAARITHRNPESGEGISAPEAASYADQAVTEYQQRYGCRTSASCGGEAAEANTVITLGSKPPEKITYKEAYLAALTGLSADENCSDGDCIRLADSMAREVMEQQEEE